MRDTARRRAAIRVVVGHDVLVSLQRQQLAVVEQFNAAMRPVLAWREATEAITAQLRAVTDAQKAIGGAFASVLHELKEARPRNWPQDSSISEVAKLIEETGWPLVWLPNEDVMTALLACDSAVERERVLLGSRPLIVREAGLLLAEVTSPHLDGAAECAREAIDALEKGLDRASQALSATVLSSILFGLGHTSFNRARKALPSDWGELPPAYLRWGLIASTVLPALSWFEFGGPVPVRFNRHASAHVADPTQFTPVNAIVGVLIVTALLRELQEIEGQGLSTEFRVA